jgi:hypothetical protein
MRLVLPLALLLLVAARSSPCLATERCQAFYGRMVLYPADGQLRLWHIGTHHEFQPEYTGSDGGASWDKAVDLLKAGNEAAGAAGDNTLYADFVVCPTEPLRKGWVQSATIRSMSHIHVVPRP